jgi:hypothetical protein
LSTAVLESASVDSGVQHGNAIIHGTRMKGNPPVFYIQTHKPKSIFVDIINREILKYFLKISCNFFWIYPLVDRIYRCVVVSTAG